jgi:hypothetical protein
VGLSNVSDTGNVRMPFVTRCEVRQGDRVVPGLICNFSAHGCFLHVDPVPSGEFDLTFTLPDGGPPVEARVAVKWVNEGGLATATSLPVGCGLRFVMMAPADRWRVEALVETYRGQAALPVGAEAPESPAARVPLIAPCTLSGDFGEARGSTCNLSMFGAYVAVEPIPEAGTRVWASLALPRKRTPFEQWATVTWRNLGPPTWERPLPPGCGLRFEGVAMTDMRYLARLVEEHLAQHPPG